MQIDFNGRVAIVTGAGGGLGREHALALAARGAKVVVNDFGRTASGIETMTAAEAVVNEILKAGGQAIVSHASVTDEVAIKDTVAEAMSKWGRIDILINNAGILRDQSFAKMNLDDFRLVMDVHLMGAVICTKAVWDIMRAQNYGRIVMTTSSSGLFGNYGQSNYGAAKLALVGLMQTLSIEGAKHDILLCAGAGTFEAAHITMTGGAWVGNGAETAEHLRERLAEVTDRTGSVVPMSAEAQGVNEGTKALAAIGDINE